MIRHRFPFVLASAACALATGCASPKGETVLQKQQYIQQMKQETLNELYREQPMAQTNIAYAPGYGVFGNVGMRTLFTASGSGYGVVTDRRTGKETYMRMAEFGGGLGVGVEKFQAVLVFKDAATLDKFLTSGWDFSARASASAEYDDAGGSAGKSAELDQGIDVYRITEDGVLAGANLMGTKYWADDSLNVTAE